MTVFKLGLLLFWTLWLLVVFLTNVFEGLKLLRIVPPYWKFASQNFQAIAQATGTYQAPPWIPKMLFLGVLLWQCVALILFGRAVVSSWANWSLSIAPVYEAFGVSLGLLAAFMVADEIFKQYEVERAHVLFFAAQLVTLLAFYILPA